METSVSLLERLRTGPNEEAWQRLDDIYRPLIRRWLLRHPRLGDEAEDIVQEIMGVLIRELPGFHRQRNGSFRRWLRAITVNRVLAHHRAAQRRPQALGAPLEECPLEQLADPNSELSRLWDQEHDNYVLRRMLELIEPMFEPATLAAFRRVVFDEKEPAHVAAELGISVAAVWQAKCRVLGRLRQEAEGLID
ncbi:MAG TPA: RNA polymerase sigma factor [Gemmataceae bacterium]|nr:RNA polymerase sigma factor [Gemmataceae bacterium]